ncbi:hypothetical protein [Pseudomonas helleri]|uniref:hypothetical protein n=1 Tax=Pseudomonas helleri TaxID=1608996 RepID=UPI0021C7DCFB|nr:hypothetical protein [Pseudomonas helleri]MCU1754695.1 hypothetical protein [Pseudomonas helleri]
MTFWRPLNVQVGCPPVRVCFSSILKIKCIHFQVSRACKQMCEELVLRIPVLKSLNESVENLTASRCSIDPADNVVGDRQPNLDFSRIHRPLFSTLLQLLAWAIKKMLVCHTLPLYRVRPYALRKSQDRGNCSGDAIVDLPADILKDLSPVIGDKISTELFDSAIMLKSTSNPNQG